MGGNNWGTSSSSSSSFGVFFFGFVHGDPGSGNTPQGVLDHLCAILHVVPLRIVDLSRVTGGAKGKNIC